MTRTDPFSGMAAFVTAAELKSFSVAARKLGQTPSSVSKAISRLEADLDAKLFHRSPRLVSLTNEGEAFYAQCKDLLSTAEDARAVITGQSALGTGHLRVCLPISFGQLVVGPALQFWQKENPNTSVEVILTDRHVDIVQERYDLAIRFNQVSDSRLIAKQLPTPQYITVAAPAYVAAFGKPTTPEDLINFNCLGYIDRQTNLCRPWVYKKDGKSQHIQPAGSVQSDQGSFLLNHTLASGGLLHAPQYLLEPHLQNGGLISLLTDYQTSGPQWWLVYSYRRQPSIKLKNFIGFLIGLLE